MLDLLRPKFDDQHSVLWMRVSTHAVLMSAFVVGGLAVAFWLAPEDWGVVRTVFAGLIGAFGSYLCLFINRILSTMADE